MTPSIPIQLTQITKKYEQGDPLTNYFSIACLLLPAFFDIFFAAIFHQTSLEILFKETLMDHD